MKRYWAEKIHVGLASGIFLAILVFLYLIVSHHNRRVDLTRDKIYSLTAETLQILKQMERQDIVIHAFFADEDPVRHDVKLLLEEMATRHPHFRYEFHDPDRSPSEARRWGVDSYQTLVIRYENREERIQDFKEESLANALVRLAHPKRTTICFTRGHGESGLWDEDRMGLAQLREGLEGRHYRVKEIQPISAGIPEECQALVVAGPRYELVPREIEVLQQVPAQGKGLLLLLDPMDPGAGKSFRELVTPFGLRLTEDVIVDKVSRVFGGDFLIPLVGEFADHPVTNRFRATIFLPVARSVTKSAEVPESLTVTELARTTPGSWAETNLKKLETGDAELDRTSDLPGPVSLAAAVESEARSARTVVVGDSDFLTNAHLTIAGNQDFALNALEWLTRDDRWISIRPKEPQFEPLFLKGPQSLGIAGLSMGLLPLTVLGVGSVGIWVRHRRSR